MLSFTRMEKFFCAEKKGDRIEISGDVRAVSGDLQNGEGVFAEWNWDGENFILKNDRYGFFPVYYAIDENKFAVSSSIAKLFELGFEPEIDDAAFSVFLRFSAYSGEDTPFRKIRAVPPGSVLNWQNGKLDIQTKEFFHPEPNKISRAEAVETYAELFQKAVEKNIPDGEKFAVPLSGGRDSRHILFALEKAGRLPDACLTLLHPPPRANEDARIAGEVCRAAGVRHFLIEHTGTRFENEIRKNILTGFSAFEHGWFLALADFVNESWNVIYDGIAGDVLSAGLFLDEAKLDLFRSGNFEKAADKILFPEAYLPAILTAENYKKFSREKAIAHLTNELKRHSDAPNPVGSFYFWNRTRRCVALSPFGILGESKKIITPYLDHSLFDFLSSLPAEMFLDQRFHDETIAFAYPKFAGIGYEKKAGAAVSDHKYFRRYSREILRFGLGARKRELVNRKFLLSRCLRGILDKNYSPNVMNYGDVLVLLLQLERI